MRVTLHLLLLWALIAVTTVCASSSGDLTSRPQAQAAHAPSVCRYVCLNGGACVNGACVCPVGYVGADCAQRGCASNCRGRGYCDMSSTPVQCLCFPGFSGFDCETKADQAAALSDAAKAMLAGMDAPVATNSGATGVAAPPAAADGAAAPADASAVAGQATTIVTPAALASQPTPIRSASVASLKAAVTAAASATGVAPPAAASADAAAAAAASAAAVRRLRRDRGLCTPECASTGLCYAGSCLCQNGYTGPTCALKLCVDDCNGHGVCDQVNGGVCECYAPYTGPTCASMSLPAGRSTPRARTLDTLADVAGPAHSDDKPNAPWKDKYGLNDDFHLIERQAQAQAQAMLEIDQAQTLVQPHSDYDYVVEYVD